jgi:CheY-like chemotaxis protein
MPDSFKILLVEDNDFVRMQIATYLRDFDCELIEAREGEEALQRVSEVGRVDMAIVDVRMEPMGGFDFVRALRGDNDNTPVVLVTGDQTSDLLEQAAKYNITAVLMKPVERDRLLKVVSRTLGVKG